MSDAFREWWGSHQETISGSDNLRRAIKHSAESAWSASAKHHRAEGVRAAAATLLDETYHIGSLLDSAIEHQAPKLVERFREEFALCQKRMNNILALLEE